MKIRLKSTLAVLDDGVKRWAAPEEVVEVDDTLGRDLVLARKAEEMAESGVKAEADETPKRARRSRRPKAATSDGSE